jgi:hypothetical protein
MATGRVNRVLRHVLAVTNSYQQVIAGLQGGRALWPTAKQGIYSTMPINEASVDSDEQGLGASTPLGSMVSSETFGAQAIGQVAALLGKYLKPSGAADGHPKVDGWAINGLLQAAKTAETQGLLGVQEKILRQVEGLLAAGNEASMQPSEGQLIPLSSVPDEPPGEGP